VRTVSWGSSCPGDVASLESRLIGTVMINHGRLILRPLPRLRPGRYELTLVTGRGRHRRTLVRCSFTMR
jgi:hypothetical protein